MLDNLIDVVRKYAGDAVVNNPAVPNEKNEAVIQQAGHSITDTLKEALASGRLPDVLGYFKAGKENTHPLVKETTRRYASDLQTKLGMETTQADQVANQLVPVTMQEMAAKTTNPQDHQFNIQDIFNKLTGGKTSGFNMEKAINQFTGGKFDKDDDGDVDINDLQSMLGGTGGIGNKIKGLFN